VHAKIVGSVGFQQANSLPARPQPPFTVGCVCGAINLSPGPLEGVGGGNLLESSDWSARIEKSKEFICMKPGRRQKSVGTCEIKNFSGPIFGSNIYKFG
jgi:hypothetical protein